MSPFGMLYSLMNTKTTIYNAGRLVLPKPLRRRAGRNQVEGLINHLTSLAEAR
jgi:hypothetical protein